MWSFGKPIKPPTKAEIKAEKKRLALLESDPETTSHKPPYLVKFVWSGKKSENPYPWKHEDHLLFMGIISNMPGHCIVADRAGKIYWGYHTNNFKVLTREET